MGTLPLISTVLLSSSATPSSATPQFALADLDEDEKLDSAKFEAFLKAHHSLAPTGHRRAWGAVGAFFGAAQLAFDMFTFYDGAQQTVTHIVSSGAIEVTDSTDSRNIAEEALLSPSALSAAGGCMMHLDDDVHWRSFFRGWDESTFTGVPQGSMIYVRVDSATKRRSCVQLSLMYKHSGIVDGVGKSLTQVRFVPVATSLNFGTSSEPHSQGPATSQRGHHSLACGAPIDGS